MSKTDRIEAQIEPELKQAAEAVFAKLGVAPADVIRLFCQQVERHQGFPFEVRILNAETLAAIDAVEKHPERLKRYRNLDDMFQDWDADSAEC